jgi:hypothetical protein
VVSRSYPDQNEQMETLGEVVLAIFVGGLAVSWFAGRARVARVAEIRLLAQALPNIVVAVVVGYAVVRCIERGSSGSIVLAALLTVIVLLAVLRGVAFAMGLLRLVGNRDAA